MFSSKQNVTQILEKHFQLIYSVGLRDGFTLFCLLICIWHANRVLYPVLRGQPCRLWWIKNVRCLVPYSTDARVLEKASLTRGNEIDSSRILYYGDFKGLTRIRQSLPFSTWFKKAKGGFVCRVSLSVPAGVIYSHIPQVRVHSRTRISALLRRRY